MKLFDTTLTQLERSLDVRLARHNVLSGDIANVDTPGFVPKDVDFNAAMAAAQSAADGSAPVTSGPGMFTTHEQHLSMGGATSGGTDVPVVDIGRSAPSIDGNGVDLDRTMAVLAENGLQYAAGAKAAGKKLAILRYVVSDGAA
jgi:flagellar basal-body rod protein FlgB